MSISPRNLRRIAAPAAICLLAGLGASFAQTVNKALQLSQDASGAFSVDSYNGVYFPGHILTKLKGRPAVSVTGTGTPTVAGTDTAGVITMGSSATTATLLFGTAYASVPYCVVSPQNAFTTTNIAYTIVTTSIAMTQNSTSGNKINYFCAGPS